MPSPPRLLGGRASVDDVVSVVAEQKSSSGGVALRGLYWRYQREMQMGEEDKEEREIWWVPQVLLTASPHAPVDRGPE
jgi:hypothetical protein